MIGYADTSSVVPLLVDEPSSPACRRFWDDADVADVIVTCRLLYVEAAAALAQAHRMRRLTTDQHGEALAILDTLWAQLDIVEVDEPLVRSAAQLAHGHHLRGYDAIQA